MANWTRNKDIKKRLERRWNKGEFLVQTIHPDTFEPLRMPLRSPTAKELAHEFEAAREWVAHLKQQPFTIEYREVNHRTLGKNRIPKAIHFHTLDDILSYLGKTGQATQFQHLFNEITGQHPELAPLLLEKPLTALEHKGIRTELLNIVSYMKETPRPGIYIRQLEIPGVDTKFMERHKAWISKLLTRALPETAVDRNAKGAAAFERRFGFRTKPVRIRFRTLDPALAPMGMTDLEIREKDFRRLTINPDTIFIIENDITCLALPPIPNAIAIFGRGYALSALSNTPWMTHKPIWYWGDLDTNGFAMLDQLRRHFPQTRSFLMDDATLLSHKPFWGREPTQKTHDLPLLTPNETTTYNTLRQNRYAPNLRLEQERINFTHVRNAITTNQNLS